jgi:hypothetical protein
MGTNTGGKSLSSYLSAYPNSRIVNDGQEGGLRIAAGCIGSGWQSFYGAVDAVVVGVNNANYIYDFEVDGVHVTSPSTGDNMPNLPTFSDLTPAPFSTVAPGSVQISAEITGTNNITKVTMQVGGSQLTPTISGADGKDVTATATQMLSAGVYTVTMTATDSSARTFSTQWDIVASSNTGDNEWFNANGTPKADQINATITSLVQAFRYHLYGQSWDGKPHPEMPTHANSITQAAPLSNWVNGTTFDEDATNATLTSLVEAFAGTARRILRCRPMPTSCSRRRVSRRGSMPTALRFRRTSARRSRAWCRPSAGTSGATRGTASITSPTCRPTRISSRLIRSGCASEG